MRYLAITTMTAKISISVKPDRRCWRERRYVMWTEGIERGA